MSSQSSPEATTRASRGAATKVKYVVGYAGDKRSKDAVRLAGALARAFHAEVEIVCVVWADDPYQQVYPPVGDISPMLREQARSWLADAKALVPNDVAVRTHVRTASSTAEGLLNAVNEFGARMVIVGGASGKYSARFSVGPAANALLHSADVPVALAPRGYKATDDITHLYAGVGARSGGQRILKNAVEVVRRSGAELELINFLPLDEVQGEAEGAVEAVRQVLDKLAQEEGEGQTVGLQVASGKHLKQAIASVEWKPGSVFLVGSSRLAGESRTFLGTTAARALRHLPVPMIVLPRNAMDTTSIPTLPGKSPSQDSAPSGPAMGEPPQSKERGAQ